MVLNQDTRRTRGRFIACILEQIEGQIYRRQNYPIVVELFDNRRLLRRCGRGERLEAPVVVEMHAPEAERQWLRGDRVPRREHVVITRVARQDDGVPVLPK